MPQRTHTIKTPASRCPLLLLWHLVTLKLGSDWALIVQTISSSWKIFHFPGSSGHFLDVALEYLFQVASAHMLLEALPSGATHHAMILYPLVLAWRQQLTTVAIPPPHCPHTHECIQSKDQSILLRCQIYIYIHCQLSSEFLPGQLCAKSWSWCTCGPKILSLISTAQRKMMAFLLLLLISYSDPCYFRKGMGFRAILQMANDRTISINLKKKGREIHVWIGEPNWQPDKCCTNLCTCIIPLCC